MTLTTIGLDLAKLVFQVHGVDESGRAVLKRKLHRHEVATFFEELPVVARNHRRSGSRTEDLSGSQSLRLERYPGSQSARLGSR